MVSIDICAIIPHKFPSLTVGLKPIIYFSHHVEFYWSPSLTVGLKPCGTFLLVFVIIPSPSLTVGLKLFQNPHAYRLKMKSPSLTVGLKPKVKVHQDKQNKAVSIPHGGLKTSNLHTKKSKKYQAFS